MANSFHGKDEEFIELINAAREQVNRLSQHSNRPDSEAQNSCTAALRELHSLLAAMERRQDPVPANQPLSQPQPPETKPHNGDMPRELFFESSLIGIGFGDLQGNIIEANDTFLRLLGYSNEDLQAGKLNLQQITPPEYRQLDEWILAELQQRGMFKPHEKEYFHKNGKRIPALTEFSLLNNPKYQVLSVIQDIRGRRQIEEALRDSEERYRTIVNTARDGIWMIDESGRITFANQRLAEMLGYSLEEMRLASLLDFVEPACHTEAQRLLDERVDGAGKDFDFRFRRKDGSELWAIVSRNTLVDREGRLICSLGMMTDITERKRAEEKLRENEEKFRQLADNIEDVFWILEIEPARFVYISPAFEEIFGLSPEPFYKNFANFFRAVHRQDREVLLSAFEEARKTGEFACEYRVILPDGSIRWLYGKGRVIVNRQGEIYRLVGITEDITEPKKIEEILKLQAQILDNLTEGVFVTNKDGLIILTNPAMDALFGYEVGSLLGEPLTLLNNYSAEENVRLLAEIQDSLTQEGFWSGELIHRKKDSSLFLSYCRVLPIETGNQQAWVTTLQDITDWKQATEQLEEQAALINQSPDAILVRDMKDRVIFWNMGAESLYGWSAEEVLGKDIQQLLNGNNVEELAAARKQLLESGDWAGELNHITKDGRKLIVRTRWTLVRDEQGHMQSVLDINTDITKQKEIESRLLRTQRLESIGTLATGIAHDVNNILAPILIAIDVLKLRLRDEDSQHFLAMLKINTQRGTDLINQVLSFAKGIKSPHQLLQLKYLMEEIIHILEGTLPKSIRLKLSLDEDLAMVTGDATQIQQVLMNLCTNAQDAMPDGGELLIAASNVYVDNLQQKDKPFVKITVADTGTGIPAELLDRIFEPFFTTKEVGKGTGLGLATVLGILRGHEGFIEVNSKLGSGTTFEVYLPANDETQAQQVGVEDLELPFGNQERVLLIDDEPILGETLKRILEQFDYRIVIANGGEQALRLYASEGEQINLALIDIMMPDMDGLTVIRALRKINPQVKIIAISGLDANAELQQALGSGAVQTFLRKPFTTSTLLKALQETLRS
jgi:PAS domain S-box-containing protein